MRATTSLMLLALAVAPAHARAQEIQFHKLPIRRLSPRAISQLPHEITRYLVKGGYTIPQLWVEGPADPYRKPHNVIRGSFRKRGEVDWAALCSRNDTSAIVIFWGGQATDRTEFGRAADDDWTQDIDGKRNLGYSRLLMTASPKRILEKNPSPEPGATLHDAIEDVFAEKGSSIYYWKNGVWLDLEGSD